jgi:hypothetical protein
VAWKSILASMKTQTDARIAKVGERSALRLMRMATIGL